MSPKVELLAPGGDIDAIKAAIIAGADAVYCGLDTFNARNRAANISFEQLVGIIQLGHHYQCKIFLTLNIVILEQEFKSLAKLLSKLVNTPLDGVIVQDLGMFMLIKKYFPSLELHASTQLTTHNAGQIPFLKKLGASRVNLSRELNLREITALSTVAQTHDVLTEVFVHGSLCVAFSGLCYSTSASVGNSGNRGRCSQACREEYQTTPAGYNFPLNLKDNSAFFDLPALIAAGVNSFKIEGRIKGANYVHTVVDSFRKQIDGFVKTGALIEDGERLYKVFNRDFSNAFLRGDLNQSMFIDNPRDHSTIHALNQHSTDKANSFNNNEQAIPVVQIHDVKQNLQDEKNQINARVSEKVKHLNIEKTVLTLRFSAVLNEPLTVEVNCNLKASEQKSFIVKSTSLLTKNDHSSIDTNAIEKRFKSLNNAQFSLNALIFDNFATSLSIPFKELTALKNQVALLLNNNKAILAEVKLPALKRHAKAAENTTKLSILINDENDSTLADDALTDSSNADIFFKLPDAYKRGCTKYVTFLQQNPRLIPWFPAVLIGKDYDVAINILEKVQPALIVTNNTGIAYKAYQLGIKWIAGPFLNTTNSYALMALKEEFACNGAFISNEINRQQMRNIARPENFKLFYSIYHPILLMTSRQCFFQQSVGCDKPRIDNGCMLSCDKKTSITNLKGVSFTIDKQKAGYPSIYNQDQFLNTDIISDLSELFDGFMIDLTNIGAGDKARLNKTLADKVALIKQFEQLLNNQVSVEAEQSIKIMVPASTNSQYYTGL
jgi:U32 family peptidase